MFTYWFKKWVEVSHQFLFHTHALWQKFVHLFATQGGKMQVHHNFFLSFSKKVFFKEGRRRKNNWCFSASITGCQRRVIFRGVKNLSFSIIESTRQNVGRKNPLTITAAPEGGRRKVSCCACAQRGRASKLLIFFFKSEKSVLEFSDKYYFFFGKFASTWKIKKILFVQKNIRSYIFFSTFWG